MDIVSLSGCELDDLLERSMTEMVLGLEVTDCAVLAGVHVDVF